MFTGGFQKMSRSEAKSLAEGQGEKYQVQSLKNWIFQLWRLKTNKEKVDQAIKLKIKIITEKIGMRF